MPLSINGHIFIEIGEGVSCLGSDELDPYASVKEKPLREVFVSTFKISKYPTTFSQYANYLMATSLPFPQSWLPLSATGFPAILEERGNYPVTNISWEAANAYCQWLSGVSGEKVCLPTEAEWEKAARGGDARVGPWGNVFDANLCNCFESGRNDFCEVTDYEAGASPYGCLHMAGGVWEWCYDFHSANAYLSALLINPVNLIPAYQRVVKGGSAFCTKEIVRPACRDWTNSINQGGGDDGFRVIIRPYQ